MRAKWTVVGLSIGLLGAAVAGGVALASSGGEPEYGAPTEVVVEDAADGEGASITNPDADEPDAGEGPQEYVGGECDVGEDYAYCEGSTAGDKDVRERPAKP